MSGVKSLRYDFTPDFVLLQINRTFYVKTLKRLTFKITACTIKMKEKCEEIHT